MAFNHRRSHRHRQSWAAVDADVGPWSRRRQQQRRLQSPVPDRWAAQYSIGIEVFVLERILSILPMVCAAAAQTTKLPPRPEDGGLAKIRAAREEPAKVVELTLEMVRDFPDSNGASQAGS